MLKPGGFLLALQFTSDVESETNPTHAGMEVVYSVKDPIQTLRLLRKTISAGRLSSSYLVSSSD